jgi:hypothetical protein
MNNRIVVASPTGNPPEKAEATPLEREMTRGLPRLDVVPPSPPANSESDEPN